MKTIHMVTLVLVLIGALNWGLVGLFGFNLVTTVFGTSALTTLTYVLVGISAIYHILPLLGVTKTA